MITFCRQLIAAVHPQVLLLTNILQVHLATAWSVWAVAPIMQLMRARSTWLRMVILVVVGVILVRVWRSDMLTSSYIQSIFDYKDGNLYNKDFRGPRALKGAKAGSTRKDGYVRINVDGKSYLAHRLIWLWHGKELIQGLELDHINGNKSDNRIENLRQATRLQNEYNKPKRGYRFESGKWRMRMKINGKNKHLGMFDTEEQAKEFYNLAAELVHGEYRHEART
jgi:hypothetical protein